MYWDEKEWENPVMTFPIKKRINTSLFIDRTAALCKGVTIGYINLYGILQRPPNR